MNPFSIKSGIFIDSTNTSCGHVFDVIGYGAFHPLGKVEIFVDGGKTREPTKEEVNTHNQTLAEERMVEMKRIGKGIMYLQFKDGKYSLTDWLGDCKVACNTVRVSNHNIAGQNGRIDVYFTLGGKRWHGVNIGDNQVCRIHVLKRQ